MKLGLLLCGLCATTAFAAPVNCSPGSLASYIALGSVGCTDGTLTYFDFKFVSSAQFPFSLISPPITSSFTKVANAGNINVTIPPYSGNEVGKVSFQSNNFEVGDGDKLRYLFGYTIDPPPDILPGFDLGMDAFSPVFPGSATIDAAVCAGGTLGLLSLTSWPPKCLPTNKPETNFTEQLYTLHVEHLGNTFDLTDQVQFETPTNFMQVWMLVTLNGGPASSTDVLRSQINGATAAVSLPEPSSRWELAANMSMLALLIFSFRRRLAIR